MSTERITDKLKHWERMKTQEIVTELDMEGVKGERAAGCECPIAVALKKVINPDDGLYVGSNGTLLYNDHRNNPVKLTLPASVQLFIRMFDMGQFPELEAPEYV